MSSDAFSFDQAETFSAGNVDMGGQADDNIGNEPEDAVVDVDDEYTSTAVNFERLKVDLTEYNERPAYSIDPNDRISRYMLFKIADFVVNAYPPWYRFVFVETDKSRVDLLRKGVRHDITGDGHATLMSETGVDGFDMEQGMPKTIDDETAREYYQAKYEAGTSKYDGEEMMRRYRFSVVVSKLVEVLYRRGYDLEVGFKAQVKMCNSASEDPDTETTHPRKDVLLAIGTVVNAMGEAIKIAFKADTYSFFSQMRPRDNYAFDLKDLQSFIAFKSRGKITGELAHVMHYYEVDPVPSFQELVNKRKRKQEGKPLQMKFLNDTPLLLHRGVNTLMPLAPPSRVETQQDEQMVDTVQEESVAMEVEEVTEFATPAGVAIANLCMAESNFN